MEIKDFDFAINESVISYPQKLVLIVLLTPRTYKCAPFIFIFKIRLYMPLSFKANVMYPINSKFCDFSIGPMYQAKGKKCCSRSFIDNFNLKLKNIAFKNILFRMCINFPKLDFDILYDNLMNVNDSITKN